MADYDYIIVGAGSAGGALAARLSENPAQQGPAARGRRAPAIPTPACRCQLRPADRQPGRQLALPVRARAGHRQPHDPGAARQAAGRLELDQRPGLGARPAARLRHLGADGLPRLELAATWRRSSPASRTSSTATAATAAAPAGPLQGLDGARPEPALRRAVQGRRGRRLQAQPRLQQRGPGRRRQDPDLDLQGPAHERGPLLHRAGDEAVAQPARRHRAP